MHYNFKSHPCRYSWCCRARLKIELCLHFQLAGAFELELTGFILVLLHFSAGNLALTGDFKIIGLWGLQNSITEKGSEERVKSESINPDHNSSADDTHHPACESWNCMTRHLNITTHDYD